MVESCACDCHFTGYLVEQRGKDEKVYTKWTYTLWPPLTSMNLDWTLPWHELLWKVLVPKCGRNRACSTVGKSSNYVAVALRPEYR